MPSKSKNKTVRQTTVEEKNDKKTMKGIDIVRGMCSGDIDSSLLNTYTMMVMEHISKNSKEELQYYIERTKAELNFIPYEIKCIIIFYSLSKEYNIKSKGVNNENIKYSDYLQFFVNSLNERGNSASFFETLTQLCEEHQNRQLNPFDFLKQLDVFLVNHCK